MTIMPMLTIFVAVCAEIKLLTWCGSKKVEDVYNLWTHTAAQTAR